MSRPPVVLVHGWLGSPSGWRQIDKGLKEQGWVTYLPHFPARPWQETLRYDGYRLRQYLDETLHEGRPLSKQPAVLAGYSRGGLVIRSYERQFHPNRLAGIIYIGVPLLGSPWSALKVLRPTMALRELDQGSDVIRWLQNGPDPLETCTHLAICGRASDLGGMNDLIVWEESATMEARIPAVHVDLRPSTDAWHGNLTFPYWIGLPPPFQTSDRAWPHTLRHMLTFLGRLPR